jgi:glyoxylase I family protein
LIKSVDHINIVVSNLEKSVRFYTEILGFRIIRDAHLKGEWIERIVGLKRVEAKVVYVVANGGEPRIELLQYVSPKGELIKDNSHPNTLGLRHVAFQVDDIHTLYKKLILNNVTVFGEPVKVPSDVIKHDAGQKTLLYFLDPDGVVLELAEYN